MDGGEAEIEPGSVPGIFRRAVEDTLQHLLVFRDEVPDMLCRQIRIPVRVHAENAEGDEATENEQVRDSSPPEQESRQEDGEEDGKKGNEEVKRYKEVIPEDNSENIEDKKREKGSIHIIFGV
jgi:hypothetical protein